ncbi:hypothetical protein HYW84_01690 [Candidatus Peregrinibacteria bacterium]|nr:hypothetical protein [Candidatus Peregrinibacteria bacterium]
MSLEVCSNGKIAFAQDQMTCDILCDAEGEMSSSSADSSTSGTSSSFSSYSSSSSSSADSSTSGTSSSFSSYSSSSSSATSPSVCSLFECALGGNDECISLRMGCNQLTVWPCWRCQGLCGNHELDYPEKCDDGNTRDGDGCSAQCEIEDSFCAQGGAGQLNNQLSGGGISPAGSSAQSPTAGAPPSPSGAPAPSGSMAAQAGPVGSIVTTVGCQCSSALPWQSMNCSIRALNAGSDPVRVSRVSAELPQPMHFAAEQRPGWPYMTLWAPNSSLLGEATANCGMDFDWQSSACNRLDWSTNVTVPPGGYLLTVVGVLNFPQQGSGPLAITVAAPGQPDSLGSAAVPTAVCR